MRAESGIQKRIRQTSDSTAGAVTLHGTSVGDLDGGLLAISTAKMRSNSAASRDSYLAIVQAGSSSATKFAVRTKSGSNLTIVLYSGQFCILDIDSVVTDLPWSEWILRYHIPQRSLRAFAEHRGIAQIDSLHCHVVYSDPILHHMSRAMILLIGERPSALEPLGDSFLRSFYSHILDCYGRKGFAASFTRGGLAGRHMRMIDEALAASLGKEMRPGLFSSRCGLSLGHFSRAFRKSYGLPFHQYLIGLRIRRAKALLRSDELSLPVIAERVGYVNQATFTQSFTKVVGTSPGRFRRSFRGAQSVSGGVLTD